MKKTMIQQGDVQFLRVAEIPATAKRQKATERGFVLADGEVTGHAHICPKANVQCFVLNNLIYLQVARAATVTHEEHKAVTIPAGIWEVGRVREVDPFEGEIRQVQD